MEENPEQDEDRSGDGYYMGVSYIPLTVQLRTVPPHGKNIHRAMVVPPHDQQLTVHIKTPPPRNLLGEDSSKNGSDRTRKRPHNPNDPKICAAIAHAE